MAEADKLTIGLVKPMPKIFGVNGEEMASSDLKEDDILVVFWAEPTKHKAETSVVRFKKFGEGIKADARKVVFLSEAKYEPLIVCCYPLSDIREMRFCARSSSASSLIFCDLHELYKENRILTARVQRIKERLMKLGE